MASQEGWLLVRGFTVFSIATCQYMAISIKSTLEEPFMKDMLAQLEAFLHLE